MNHLSQEYTFQRYLIAKRTVDDRALNCHVWESLHQALAARAQDAQVPTLVEIGGGIGTMVDRLLEDGRIAAARYHLIDEQADNIDAAFRRLQKFAHPQTPTGEQQFSIAPSRRMTLATTADYTYDLSLYTGDFHDFLAHAGSLAATDLVIAHAFMDLVNVPSTLPLLTATLQPGTLLYFTINFDGATIFEPAIDPAFDTHVMQLYHRTMDERITNGKPSGDSHTGRHLFHQMQSAGIHTLNAGSSDWVVFPHRGTYPHDEAYFLHFILHTLHGALHRHEEVDARRFELWIQERHAQVERGELLYIAHQLDYLAEFQGVYQAGSNSGASIATSRPSA